MGLLTKTSQPSIRVFGISYGAYTHIAAGSINAPGFAPASNQMSAVAAISFPFASAPSFIIILAPGVGPVVSNTAVRSMTILTGRPDFFERRAASGSK